MVHRQGQALPVQVCWEHWWVAHPWPLRTGMKVPSYPASWSCASKRLAASDLCSAFHLPCPLAPCCRHPADGTEFAGKPPFHQRRVLKLRLPLATWNLLCCLRPGAAQTEPEHEAQTQSTSWIYHIPSVEKEKKKKSNFVKPQCNENWLPSMRNID